MENENILEEEVSILTLTDENGADVEFEYLDCIDYEGKEYLVLIPVEEEANEIKEQCKADGKKDVEVLPSKLQTDAATAVVSGKADVFYADSPVAGYAISQTGDELEELGSAEGVVKQGVAVKKGDTELAKAVQAGMQHLMDDGDYMKILKTWGVENGAIDKAEINPTDLG